MNNKKHGKKEKQEKVQKQDFKFPTHPMLRREQFHPIKKLKEKWLKTTFLQKGEEKNNTPG